MTGTALAAPVRARANRPHGVRPRVGLLCGAVNSPVRPGGYLTAWKAANTIKATTMTLTGCQSCSRWPIVSDKAGHGGLVIPAQLSGTPSHCGRRGRPGLRDRDRRGLLSGVLMVMPNGAKGR